MTQFSLHVIYNLPDNFGHTVVEIEMKLCYFEVMIEVVSRVHWVTIAQADQ